MFTDVLTVTVSPEVNPPAGTKLPPRPSESPRSLPLWLPLREPVTVMRPSWLTGIPRKTI
jgi:hypothetical protein